MKFCRTSVALLLAAATGVTAASSIGSNSLSSSASSSFGVVKKNVAFSVQGKLSNSDLITSIRRGGSTAAAQKDEEEETEEKPQVLYLPGLLDAVVAKKKVRDFCLCAKSQFHNFPIRSILLQTLCFFLSFFISSSSIQQN